MSIKIYVNGTPGSTDGKEITSLTIKNLIQYAIGSDNTYLGKSTVFLPIFLREENGFTATNVILESKKTEGLNTGCAACGTNWPSDDLELEYYNNQNNIGTVGQQNILVYIGVSVDAAIASGTELFTISYAETAA